MKKSLNCIFRVTTLIPEIVLVSGLLFLFTFFTQAAQLYFEPVRKVLPDGKTISLFVSGDEFFNWLHDKNGFPVGEGKDGFYYYLIQNEDDFIFTGSRADLTDPLSIPGLTKVRIPSFVQSKRDEWQKHMDELSIAKGTRPGSKSPGILNNLVIYIKFKGESDFTVPRSVYETRFNSITGPSVRDYFREVSYDQLDIASYHLPGGTSSGLSYTDQYARNYYQPYNETTNPSGYKTSGEKALREHFLLANAAAWIDASHDLPPGVDFDSDNDGDLDNACFIIRGSADGWNELLWPHRWSLYSVTAKIDGMRIWDYTLQLESVSVTVLVHEIFHVIGAPDLYHYNNSDKPVGPWDIMANGGGHPGAWMKYRYGKWLSKIPEIMRSGTYTIRPISDTIKCCYLLKSPYREDQVFVIEYRKKAGLYESLLPSSGMIITRIDSRHRGNSAGPPDEIYVFRKNGGYTLPGEINSAEFSAISGRTSFSDNTNPYAFFQEGGKTAIYITGIISMGDSMRFTVEMDQPLDVVILPENDTRMNLTWKGSWNRDYVVAVSRSQEPLSPVMGKAYSEGDTIGKEGIIVQNKAFKYLYHTGLDSDEQYYYSLWTITGKNPYTYSKPVRVSARTGIFNVSSFPYYEDFDNSLSELPRGWKSSTGITGWEYNVQNSFSPPNSVSMKPGNNPDYLFFTPGFELSGTKTYMVSYRYRNTDRGTNESLALKLGISRYGGAIDYFTVLKTDRFSYNDYVIQKSVFKLPVSGIYYMGFKVEGSGPGVLIDDIKIEEVPATTVNHDKPDEFYPNPTTGIITIPATGYTELNVYRMDGTKVYETAVESMQEVDLSPVGKGMFILKFISGSNSYAGKIIIL